MRRFAILALQLQKNALRMVFCFMAFSSVLVSAQQLADTLWLPVTFYDFHADGSNPEFNPNPFDQQSNPGNAARTGMVADQLDADKKPVRHPNLSNVFFSYNIGAWFRPWKPGNFQAPQYDSQGKGTFVQTVTLSHDTAFKNVVIQDSLPFIHIGNGIYEFVDSDFFMLDGRGFGKEPLTDNPSNHNYSFTMELHTSFTYQPNLKFEFLGDDDVWAFVNNELALDIGGIHGAVGDTLDLNTLTGLNPGQKYDFDFFYCERRVTKSSIKITTNLFTPISGLEIYPSEQSTKPYSANETIKAGQKVDLYARVFDSTQARRTDLEDDVVWRIYDERGNLVFTDTTGNYNSFTPTEAYGNVTITAEFRDKNDPSAPPTVKNIEFYVGPGDPDHIEIVSSSTISDSLNSEGTIDSLYLDNTTPSSKIYAIIRDKYGNFVSYADQAQWQSINTGIVDASATSGKQYEGTVTRRGGGETIVVVKQTGIKADTLKVATDANRVNLVSATTGDADGNGYLDRIVCVFDTSISFGLATNSLKIVYGSTTFPVDTITQAAGDSVFVVHLDEQITKEMQTGWRPTLSFAAFDRAAAQSGYVCLDGAGPVIQEALYYPGGLSSNAPDTLRVTFSERVSWAPIAPLPDDVYNYYEESFKSDTALSGIGSDQMVQGSNTATILMVNGFQITPEKDSLQLAGGSPRVVDTTGNQPPSGGRKVPIRWGVENTIQFGAINNPFVIGESMPGDIYRKVTTQYSRVLQNSTLTAARRAQGAIVGVQSLKPVAEQSDGSYGTAAIYDALGNLVQKDIRVDAAQKENHYGLFWDGLNRNGRKVGRGTYLFLIKITDIDGDEHVIRAKLGIKG